MGYPGLDPASASWSKDKTPRGVTPRGALQRLGFAVPRQRGSHIVMRRVSAGCVVPNHRELESGTLAGLLKQAGVSPEELVGALKYLTTVTPAPTLKSATLSPGPLWEARSPGRQLNVSQASAIRHTMRAQSTAPAYGPGASAL